MQNNLDFIDVVKAYLKCRKHKPKNFARLNFEFNLEENLYQLFEELNEEKYEIGKSICFMVLNPKPREVWAAEFRDRIVHHFVYEKIFDRFYKTFINDTYSCIPKRGTLRAALATEKHARSITRNYTKKAYFLKCDIKNFFVSIDKNILYSQLLKKVDDPFLQRLLKQIIYNPITKKVIIKSPPWKFNLLPKYKSLWFAPECCGLPIGNLTSQFFSNVYLDDLDKFVKHILHCKHYCRYVDDFILMDYSSKKLLQCHKHLTEFLLENLSLQLHQGKKVINLVTNGFDFVGFVVKPFHRLLRVRTVKRIYTVVKSYFSSSLKEPCLIQNFIRTMNSYIGFLRSVNAFFIRKEICTKSVFFDILSDHLFNKLIIPRLAVF